jgi:hypothetical protein
MGERERERVFIDGLISRIVYIASLRLGGRKLPTYELMLHLLGVATMYGWISRCRNGK